MSSDQLAYPGDTALAIAWPKPPIFWPARYDGGGMIFDTKATLQWVFWAETTRWAGCLLPDGHIYAARRAGGFYGDLEAAYAEARRRCAACTKLTRKRPHTVYTLAI